MKPRARGMAVPLTLASLALVAALAASYSLLPKRQSSTNTNTQTGTFTPQIKGVMLAGRLGLDPETLAAAGVQAEQATQLVQSAVDFIQTNGDALNAADELAATKRNALTQLKSRIAAGLASEQEIAGLSIATVDQQSSAAARDAILASAKQATVGALCTAEQAAKIDRIHANRVWNLPVQYLVVDRTPTEWRTLKIAMNAIAFPEGQAQSALVPPRPQVTINRVTLPGDPSPTQTTSGSSTTDVPVVTPLTVEQLQALLTQADAQADVAAAASALTNKPAISAAMDAFIRPQ